MLFHAMFIFWICRPLKAKGSLTACAEFCRREFGITHTTIQFEHEHESGEFHKYMPGAPRQEEKIGVAKPCVACRSAAELASGGGDALQSIQVRPKGFRHHHGTICLLVIFQDRQPGSAHRQAAAVQRVDAAPSCPPSRGGSAGWRAAPGKPQNSSRRKSLYIPGWKAATLPGRRFWRS